MKLNLLILWAWTSSFQNYKRIYFYCGSHPVCGTWSGQPEKTFSFIEPAIVAMELSFHYLSTTSLRIMQASQDRFCSPWYHQSLAKCLACSRCSLNTSAWMNKVSEWMNEHMHERNSNYIVVLPLGRLTCGMGSIWKQGHLVLANMGINMHLCPFSRNSKFLEFQVFSPSEKHCLMKFNLVDFIFKEPNISL